MNVSTQPKESKPYLCVRFQVKYSKCNLKCPYCGIDWQKQDSTFDFDSYRDIINKIKELPYNMCLVTGVGGEIFTSPEILSVLKNVCNEKNNIFSVNFTTNLQASWDNIIEPFLQDIDPSKLAIACTLHDTVIKDIDLFFEKAHRLKQRGVLVNITYVALPRQIHLIEKYKERCDKLGIPLILNAYCGIVEQGANGEIIYPCLSESGTTGKKLLYPRDYTNEERNQLKRLCSTPHNYKIDVEVCNTRGMKCSAGKNYVYVDESGNVFPCKPIRNIIGEKTSMGNILHDTITISSDAKDAICPAETCMCGNENPALRIVDEHYDRTRATRVLLPKKGISQKMLYKGYNPSIYSLQSRIKYKLKQILSKLK